MLLLIGKITPLVICQQQHVAADREDNTTSDLPHVAADREDNTTSDLPAATCCC